MVDNRRMSEDDINRAKVRAQDDYVQCKARLSVLESEARYNAQLLDKVCDFLRDANRQARFSTGGLEDALSGKLIVLMNDLHDTRELRKILHKTLTDMGLDLKD
jgi:hypothetical protein